MDLTALLIFALALLVAAGSPGPSIAALIARVLTCGWRDVAPFVVAMWLGEALWLTGAIVGLSALAQSVYWLFVLVKYAGVAYLLYLAWRLWCAPVAVGSNAAVPLPRQPLRMFLAGFAVTMGNPKIMLFYLALLPTIIDLDGVTVLGWVGLTATMIAVLAIIDIAYIVFASRVRLLLKTPRAMRMTNRLSAALLGSAATLIATR